MYRIRSALLALVAPLVHLVAAAPFWWDRPLFDDELHTLAFGPLPSPAAVWSAASGWDVHPPLHYVYGWLLLRLPLQAESIAVLSGLLATTAALVVLWLLLAGPLGWSRRAACLGCCLGALHPTVLLYGSAMRWYPLWMALALLLIHAASRWRERPSPARAALAGLAAVAALACSYLTLPLLLGLALWLLLPMLRERPAAGWWRRAGLGAAILLAIVGAYMLSQHEALGLHWQGSEQATASAWWKAAGYDLFAVVVGQSIMPWQWHWVAIAGLSATALVVLGRRALLNGRVASLTGILLVEMVVLTAATGFVKPRSFLLLSLLLGPALVELAGRSRLRWLVGAPLLLVWLVGGVHVAQRSSLHKAGLMDPVREVAAAAMRHAGDDGLVLVTDPLVAYYLGRLGPAERPRLCSAWTLRPMVPVDRGCTAGLDAVRRVVLIDSRLGSARHLRGCLPAVARALERWAGGPGQVLARLSRDAHWRQKNRCVPGAAMRPWRFVLRKFRGHGPPPAVSLRACFRTGQPKPEPRP